MNITASHPGPNTLRAATLLAMVVAITSAGCQQQSDQTSNETERDQPATTAPDELAEPKESAEASDTASTRTKQGDDSEQHADGGHGHVEQGMGHGRGGRRMGREGMGGFRPDMTTIHAMFAASDKIQRTVKNLPNGAEATTESDNEEIVALIQEHVPAMETRVMEDAPLPPMTFHPIFVNLIKHSKDYTLKFEETEKGMKVVYKAEDPFVVMLVQQHAKLVSRFLKNGMSEIHKEYTLPDLGDQKDPAESK